MRHRQERQSGYTLMHTLKIKFKYNEPKCVVQNIKKLLLTQLVNTRRCSWTNYWLSSVTKARQRHVQKIWRVVEKMLNTVSKIMNIVFQTEDHLTVHCKRHFFDYFGFPFWFQWALLMVINLHYLSKFYWTDESKYDSVHILF